MRLFLTIAIVIAGCLVGCDRELLPKRSILPELTEIDVDTKVRPPMDTEEEPIIESPKQAEIIAPVPSLPEMKIEVKPLITEFAKPKLSIIQIPDTISTISQPVIPVVTAVKKPIFVLTALEKEEVKRWKTAEISPRKEIQAMKVVDKYRLLEPLFQKIADAHENGVPPYIIAVLLYREADLNIRCHPHNGDSLMGYTHNVPAHRLPPPKTPPFDFVESGIDAYYVTDKLQKCRDWKHPGIVLSMLEGFNGLGYWKRGLSNPYILSGTNLYKGGKYVRDRVYDSQAWDGQLGLICILKALEKAGIDIHFTDI